MVVYRISRKRFATDLSGSGAKRYGGRWNPKGVSLVYASESRALAVLEYYVHTDPALLPMDISIASIRIPDDAPGKEIFIGDLPPDWREYPPPVQLAILGENWFKSDESLLLLVPSVVVPRERNVLVNPGHSLIKEVTITDIEDYSFGRRLGRG
ncbi:MAG TPA: RES domain-containing protein [Syntrophorhabdaceae bacterium]|nr:RES domain-containing protein [Syntrophorhabdaceae bacterium]